MTPQRRRSLEAMAQASESPNEAFAARRVLGLDDPWRRPVIEHVEAWESVHGDCPVCAHGSLRHVGYQCYGARGLDGLTWNGRRFAVETVSYCPCSMSALADGWVSPPEEALRLT